MTDKTSTTPANYGSYARQWLTDNLPEDLRIDRLNPKPELSRLRLWEAEMHKAGLAGITWPKEYAGHGLTLREHLDANREIGLAPVPLSVNSIGKELAGPIILAIGNEAQKTEYLPKILSVEDIWCQGFSEPGAGSDLAGLRTRAERVAEGWRINGQKIWTSGASKSRRCLLLARTGKPEDRHKGLVIFTVSMDLPGIDVREIQSIDGAKHFCEVFFNDVIVSDADMLGAPDEGWTAATRVLSIERATNRMYRAWRFESELSHLIKACSTEQRGRTVLQSYRREIGRVAVDIELLKGHVETLVTAMLAGEDIGPRGSFPKLFWSEAHQRFARLAQEITRQFQSATEGPLLAVRNRMQNIYLTSRAETIYAGTTEIQLDIIAKRILQLSTKGI